MRPEEIVRPSVKVSASCQPERKEEDCHRLRLEAPEWERMVSLFYLVQTEIGAICTAEMLSSLLQAFISGPRKPSAAI